MPMTATELEELREARILLDVVLRALNIPDADQPYQARIPRALGNLSEELDALRRTWRQREREAVYREMDDGSEEDQR